MAKIEEKLDRILNPGITPQDSFVNVVNNYDEIQESEDEIVNEIEEPLYNRIERISRSQNNTSNQKNWYPQPSFLDIQFKEKTLQTQALDGLTFYEWNIDGLFDYLIMNVVNEMMMPAGAYKLQDHKSDHQIAQVLVTGFTRQLKNWWDKYLDESTRQQILNHYVIRSTTQIIKEEGPSTRTEVQHKRVEDAVNTLVYTLIELFVGDPLKYQERSAEILMNLKCPTLGDFRWYKDMYFSKVLIRTDSSLEFWKENFVNGLSKHFSRRIKDGLKTKYNGTIPWQTLSYGSIASFIIKGLRLCNKSKIQNKLNSSISNRKELGRFCDQYGYKGIEAPSTSRRKKSKRIQNHIDHTSLEKSIGVNPCNLKSQRIQRKGIPLQDLKEARESKLALNVGMKDTMPISVRS